MENGMNTIFGAGLAGLMAGCLFQDAQILEAGAEGSNNHKALLRFRSSAVGDAVGIDFRKVRVHKGIFDRGRFVVPNIRLANQYSKKVIGNLADRSVWNLEPVDRYIAPENLIEQLTDRCSRRIQYNTTVDKNILGTTKGNIISTMPMSVMLKLIEELDTTGFSSENTPVFKSAPIKVKRYRLKNADIFQTIYIPDPENAAYRASITGSLLIIESVTDELLYQPGISDFADMFGLDIFDIDGPIDSAKQSFGKIAPIDDAWRKNFQFRLTHEYGIYSLGRFGTWRNLLLDDVLKDIVVIKRLMGSSAYELNRHNAK
jgi:hypothetical protein